MMKIGVFSVMLPDLTPEQAAEELKSAGYDGVEWRVTHTPPERRGEQPSFWGNNLCTLEPTEAGAHRARRLAEANGLELPSLGTYIDTGDLAAVEDTMRFAQIAGAPQFRVRPGKLSPGVSYTQAFEAATAFLAQAEPLARRYNLKLLIEMHPDTISPSAGLAHRLVSAFDPTAIGVIYDVGNMVYEGYEDYRIGLELLGPYLAHVHFKNTAFSRPEGGGIWRPCFAPLEDGAVDFPRFIAVLRAVGYDGWLAVEDFSGVRASREALRHNLTFIRNLLDSGA
jgi:sugar phosphate isomerase/epimerase